MDRIEHTDEKGRKYWAFSNGEEKIIIGPPEGLVDTLSLPEPFATNLHNALFNRGILHYQDIVRSGNALFGILQEVLQVDVQRLTEAFFKYEGK